MIRKQFQLFMSKQYSGNEKHRHFVAFLVIIVVSFLFNNKLFFPHLNLIATPEFILHDSIQLSYASKWWYAQKLHAFELPLWSAQIGNGFPILGEGQTGIFFLPNILIFGLIKDAAFAYNIILTFVPIIMASGMYLWFSLLGIPWSLALLGSLTMGLSGFTLFHLQHISLLQGFSLIPLLLAATYGMTGDKPKVWMGIFILTLSQQITTGFVQAVFIGGLASFSYYLFLIGKFRSRWRYLFHYALSVIGGIAVAAIQFIPSLEFFGQIASWERNNPNWSMQYSFPIKFLLTFIHPFLIGNPAVATYKGSTDPGSIYWENIGYIGIGPLCLLLITLFSKRFRKKSIFFLGVVVVAFLLMLGKFSPFYFIFNFFPFTLFRVPSRFIYLFSLGILLSAILTSKEIIKKGSMLTKIVIYGLWISNLMVLFPIWVNYHALKTPSEIHSKPPITTTIDTPSFIYRYNVGDSQRKRYFTYGWKDMGKYDFYKNSLMPNTNTFWQYTIADAYPSRYLKRSAILDGLLLSSISDDYISTATLSATTKNILGLTPTNWIITEEHIDSGGSYRLKESINDNEVSLYLYQIPNSTPLAFFPSQWYICPTISDMVKVLNNTTFSPNSSVLLEKSIELVPTKDNTNNNNSLKNPTIINSTQSDSRIRFSVQNVHTDSLFVVLTTYYPGWKAKVDGKPTNILPVNIKSMGIIVPKGTSTIEFYYFPESIIYGALISTITFLGISVFLLRKT